MEGYTAALGLAVAGGGLTRCSAARSLARMSGPVPQASALQVAEQMGVEPEAAPGLTGSEKRKGRSVCCDPCPAELLC